MNLRQISLLDCGFDGFNDELVRTGLPRQVGTIDVDAVGPGNKRVYKFSQVLWMDLDHLHLVLSNILNGEMGIGKPIVEITNLEDAINLIRDMKVYGIENVYGIEGLVFWCLVHDRFTTFRHFLWNVWYSYSNRVNLYTGAGVQIPGLRAVTHDEMECDGIDGEAIRARGEDMQGRWIDTRTGLPFVIPHHVVFSPYERVIVDLTNDEEDEELSESESVGGVSELQLGEAWKPEDDEVITQCEMSIHFPGSNRVVGTNARVCVLNLEEAISQEPGDN